MLKNTHFKSQVKAQPNSKMQKLFFYCLIVCYSAVLHCNAKSTFDDILNSKGLFSDDNSIIPSMDVLTSFTNALSNDDILGAAFQSFKSQHNKDPKDRSRRPQFKKNLLKIFSHNLQARLGLSSYEKGVNKFSDLTKQEFVKQFTGFNKKKSRGSPFPMTILPLAQGGTPDTWDWRNQGVVTPVKDQGQCGSCVTFSTVANIESAYALAHNQQQISLSEQELVDCSGDGQICEDGTSFDSTFPYAQQNGMTGEQNYPYTAQDGQCQMPQSIIANITAVNSVQCDVQSLQTAIATIAPISISLYAEDWMDYSSGVFQSDDCANQGPDHAVMAIGYGSESGKNYWLIKNSWSENWGESGYIKLSQTCNVQDGTYATAA